MILLCGIPSETPLALVREQLDVLGASYLQFNQRAFAEAALDARLVSGHITGTLQLDGRAYPLEHFTAVYSRLMDDQMLPELADEPQGGPMRHHARALHEALTRWCEIMPGRVVNRMAPMGSNFSKPYQAQLIRAQGFDVPDTLITNDPDLVVDFYRRHGRVIYKSISGVRSIVQELSEEDLSRLHRVRWCPTQFQAFVDGTNVRVHVVGEAVFATAARTDATDYRYAHQQNGHTELEAIALPDDLAAGCVRLTHALGLALTGIDLKVAPDGRVFCFEVNPSPAFSYYEGHTGQPIANAIASYLAEAA